MVLPPQRTYHLFFAGASSATQNPKCPRQLPTASGAARDAAWWRAEWAPGQLAEAARRLLLWAVRVETLVAR